MSELRRRLSGHVLGEATVAGPSELRTGELAAAAVQGVDGLAGLLRGLSAPAGARAAVSPSRCLAGPRSSIRSPPGSSRFTIPILIVFMVLVGRGAREQAARRWGALALLSAHFLDVVKGLVDAPRLRPRAGSGGDARGRVGESYRAETMATLRVAFLSAFVLELCAMIGTAMAAAAIGVQLAGRPSRA